MKELSIEEKSKRYDEALERAKGVIEQNPLMEYLKKGIEYILPELKESEDERIRKVLLGMVHDTTGDSLWVDYNVHKEDAIAWLEKQGKSALEAAKEEKVDNQNCVKPANKVEPIVVRDFNSVFSREKVEEIDKRIEKSQRLYNAKLRDAIRKVEDFPMTD